MPSSPNPFLLLLLVPISAIGAEATFFTERVAPVLEQHCVVCHGGEKQKAELRLDTFAGVMTGAKDGEVIVPGDLAKSEMYRRITLPPEDDDFMPSDGKPPLSADEVMLIKIWIEAGASPVKTLADFPTAPALRPKSAPSTALAPDWRPFANELATLARELGVKLVPRSGVPTDGIVLRTASAPAQCDDTTIARLKPVAELIVEAELARTPITDAGLSSLATFANLRFLDLTQTRVTSEGLINLRALPHLEVLNLTETPIDDSGLPHIHAMPSLQRVYLFGTKVTEAVN